MWPVEVHPEAYDELEEAHSWYENNAEGLGTDFLDEKILALSNRLNYFLFFENVRRFLRFSPAFRNLLRFFLRSSHQILFSRIWLMS